MIYIHVGNDRVIRVRDIIGVFDMDTSTVSSETKKFLNEAQGEGRIILTTYDLPKSFVITSDDMITLTQLSVGTIKGRIEEN